jgi:hypothetical protein
MESGDVVSLGTGSRHASPSHVKSVSGKHSLGESSNANGWFEQFNTEVQDYNVACIHNNSPFFIDDGPSIQAVPTSQRLDAGTDTRSSIAPKTSLSQLDTDYVSAETFRDIVDDLTVQIGSLKRRLRRDEKSNSLISESRKPFEIKIHSLKVDEKHELERILHRFVSGLPTRSGSEDTSNRYGDFVTSGKPYTVMSPRTSTLDTRSPHASDSASVSRLSLSASDSKRRGILGFGRSTPAHVQPDAKHDGNCMLLRETSELMTTRTKKKLVVDRLEKLFAGKNVFSGPKIQALQQPETLHEVAHVEYSIIQAWDQQTISENVCAVRMLSKETKILTTAATTEQLEATQRLQTSRLLNPKLKEKIITILPRPELEPSQLVAENVRYIRQIGLSPVDSETAKLPGDEYEWFYLNVLVNMAELHTLNVTRDFIRKAVSELSGHYIISTDGQKVRWKNRWNLVSRKRRHDDDLSENVIDETSGPKGRRLKATRAIGSPTSLRTGSRLKHTPSPWISYQSNGKLVCAPRFHFSTKDMTDSISSFNPRNGNRALTEPSDLAESFGAESIAHGYTLPPDQ